MSGIARRGAIAGSSAGRVARAVAAHSTGLSRTAESEKRAIAAGAARFAADAGRTAGAREGVTGFATQCRAGGWVADAVVGNALLPSRAATHASVAVLATSKGGRVDVVEGAIEASIAVIMADVAKGIAASRAGVSVLPGAGERYALCRCVSIRMDDLGTFRASGIGAVLLHDVAFVGAELLTGVMGTTGDILNGAAPALATGGEPRQLVLATDASKACGLAPPAPGRTVRPRAGLSRTRRSGAVVTFAEVAGTTP
jgi:hypothetical protein